MSKTNRKVQDKPWKDIVNDTKRYLLRKQEETDTKKQLQEAKRKLPSE